MKHICDKANWKTKALLRIRSYLTQAKAEILCNCFILSAFNYCPLIWMFCGKAGNNLIETVHRRSLSAVLTLKMSGRGGGGRIPPSPPVFRK